MAAVRAVATRILSLLVLPLWVRGAAGSLQLDVPATVHVELGQTLEVPCKRADGMEAAFESVLEWFYVDSAHGRVPILYRRNNFRPPVDAPDYAERASLKPGTSTLVVEGAGLQDERTFVCQITDSAGERGTGAASVRVFSLGDLEITANPEPIALNNKTALLATCRTKNSYPQLQIGWYKNGIELKSLTAMSMSLQANGLYTLSSKLVYVVTRPDHGATYHCAVSYRADAEAKSIQSDGVKINLHYPPDSVVLSVALPTVAIKERDDVVLKCTTDANPPPNYSFYRVFADDRVEVPGAVRGGLLVLRGVSADMNGLYVCRANATGKCTGHSATSSHINVVINYIDPLSLVPFGPLTVRAGVRVHVTCQSSGSGPLSYRWIKDGTTVSDSTKVVIESAQFSDAGVYTCNAWLLAHPHITASESVSLLVQGKPHILSDEDVYLQNEGSALSLLCEAVGFPKPNIKWSHAGRPSNTESIKDNKLTSELKLRVTDDLRYVTCNASNQYGAAVKVFHLQRPSAAEDAYIIILAVAAALLIIGSVAFVMWRKRRHRYRRHNGMNGTNLHTIMLGLAEMDDDGHEGDECDFPYPAIIVSSL
uniref:Basal cell adhesion molecule-like n=1 Tax=Petromyzon marinus TaxID=7757 RepID=A0AAJ7TNZ7_PETMA|nr:basal cell adhesion molecule-like [Petromyzon marinus]XP_032820336.1 basal cell adhesion molecule-like [Petromyzon marinus]